MESKIFSTSEKILTLVKQKGCMSFTELENSIDDSYNVIFLAIDKLVRENKLSLQRNTADYLLTTPRHADENLLIDEAESSILELKT